MSQFSAFHFRFFFGEDFRIERLLVFEQMPEDAGQMNSLAPARSARRTFGSAEFLSRLPKSLKCAPWR
ncbi:MAG: hypothetical protein M9920_17000 [Verrucomicrobiae bacterium]|nr:hypothetical protein [Verrucomicrobiae bacterium]